MSSHRRRSVLLAAVLCSLAVVPAAYADGLVGQGVHLGSNAPNVRTSHSVSFAPVSDLRPIARIDVEWCASPACSAAPSGVSTAMVRGASVSGAGSGWRRMAVPGNGRVAVVAHSPQIATGLVRLSVDPVRNADRTRGAVVRVTTYADAAGKMPIDQGSMPYSVLASPAIHVAPWGTDAGDGSATRPLRRVGAALDRTRGGETIQVASGDYEEVVFSGRRERPVLVRGTGPTRPRFAALKLLGAQGVTFESVATGPVTVREHPQLGTAQPASDVVLRGSEISGTSRSSGRCLYVSFGVRALAVTDSYVHNCQLGTQVSPSSAASPSVGITLRGNLFERFADDAIQFGHWHDVTIEDNLIRDARGGGHSDGIQVIGGVKGLRIRGNRVHTIDNQGIFVWPDAGFGPIQDVGIEGNVVLRTGIADPSGQGQAGWSIDVADVTAPRIVGNTVWTGLGVRLTTGVTEATVVNNVVRRLDASPGALGDWHHNYVGNYHSRALDAVKPVTDTTWCQWPAKHWVPDPPNCRGVAPGFVDEAAGDLRPAPESPFADLYAPGYESGRVGLPQPRAGAL